LKKGKDSQKESVGMHSALKEQLEIYDGKNLKISNEDKKTDKAL